MTPRNKQFSSFASLLLDEILSYQYGMMGPSDWWKEKAHDALARRAYDFAAHIVCCVEPESPTARPLSEVMRTIQDMTQWPDEIEADFAAWIATRPDPAMVERFLTRFRRDAAREE